MRKVFRDLMILLLIFAAAAFICICGSRDKHRNSYTFDEEEAEEILGSGSDDAGEDHLGEEEDEDRQEEANSPGEEQERPDPGGSTGSGGSSGQGGDQGTAEISHDDPVPIYDFFMEGSYYICKGCFLPFPDIYALNAHECSFHGSEECAHEWEPEYNDVWVEATGHYEYGIIEDGYDEAIYEERCVCKKCGEYFLTSEEAADHIIAVHGNEGSWTVVSVVVSYVHHEPVYGQIFVTDEEAHWDRVIYRYRCIKCGEIQYP